MASTRKRRFTDEFKREAVALWETGGRMQTEVAAELGIMPTMLRRWQRKLQEGSAPPASPAAKPPVSTMASPADQASEIARLRGELDRARMGRDIQKEPSASLRRCRGEVRLHRAACVRLAGERHLVPHARRVAQRLLRLARPGTERADDGQPGVACRRTSPSGTASGPIRIAEDACCPASGRPSMQPWPCRAADAGTVSARWRDAGSSHARPTAATICRSPRTCWRSASRHPRRTGSGWPTSPISRPAKGGCIWRPCSIWRPARSSAGPCATICVPSCRSPR